MIDFFETLAAVVVLVLVGTILFILAVAALVIMVILFPIVLIVWLLHAFIIDVIEAIKD